jgi:predicted urease superfamily metal-dependent hydrolase
MAGRTNATTIERLLGLMMLTDMAASTVGIYTVPRVKTHDFRLTFLGKSPPRKEAKRMMMRQCQLLGHEVKDDNAADAIGIHYHVSADILARARA